MQKKIKKQPNIKKNKHDKTNIRIGLIYTYDRIRLIFRQM